jgi:hypothetical protein
MTRTLALAALLLAGCSLYGDGGPVADDAADVDAGAPYGMSGQWRVTDAACSFGADCVTGWEGIDGATIDEGVGYLSVRWTTSTPNGLTFLHYGQRGDLCATFPAGEDAGVQRDAYRLCVQGDGTLLATVMWSTGGESWDEWRVVLAR